MTRFFQSKAAHVLSHLLFLAWMCVIFSFSAQNGESSGGLSGRICFFIVSVINDIFRFGWEQVQMQEFAAVLGYPIRKLAHMTEFGILAILFYWTLSFYPKIKTPRWIWKANQMPYILAFVLTVLYAVTDELHQLFIADRSGNFFDVCVDSAGAFLALCFIWLLSYITGRTR